MWRPTRAAGEAPAARPSVVIARSAGQCHLRLPQRILPDRGRFAGGCKLWSLSTAGATPHRSTAPFVVFLIGFRINRLLAVRQWLPVAKAMGPMLCELRANPSLGLLSARAPVYWRGAMLVQYWQIFDHLIAYAQARDAAHLPGWKAFNQSVGNDGTVGIWHETYQVAAGQYEAIYANMPRYGLAAVGRHPDADTRIAAVSRSGNSVPGLPTGRPRLCGSSAPDEARRLPGKRAVQSSTPGFSGR